MAEHAGVAVKVAAWWFRRPDVIGWKTSDGVGVEWWREVVVVRIGCYRGETAREVDPWRYDG